MLADKVINGYREAARAIRSTLKIALSTIAGRVGLRFSAATEPWQMPIAYAQLAQPPR